MTTEEEAIVEYPYIKPTRRIHDSGYSMFEVGYCWQADGRFKNRVIGTHSDHIWIRALDFLGDLPFDSISIDLTKEGFIRFFVFNEGKSKDCQLRWTDKQALSSAVLKLYKKEAELA